MINRYIDFRIFLISLALGLLLVYLFQPSPTIIYVYPTPDNANNIEYKDKANNCFKFNPLEVECPSDHNKIHPIPIQNGVNDTTTSFI